MSRLTYLVGDASAPIGDGPKIIAHCVSDNGRSYGKGFALTLKEKYPSAAEEYYARAHSTISPLEGGGIILTHDLTEQDRQILVAAMVAQHGLGSASLRLSWLTIALSDLALYAIEVGASVHLPRIGCGLAGGKWSEVSPILEDIFNRPPASFVPVYIYDLPT